METVTVPVQVLGDASLIGIVRLYGKPGAKFLEGAKVAARELASRGFTVMITEESAVVMPKGLPQGHKFK